MKYMVVVNQKFMVAVEANSALAAEHEIINNFAGIDGAQAFDREAMKTDTFAGFLMDCETISLGELKDKADKYEAALKEEATAELKVENMQEAIERAEAQLSKMRSELTMLQIDKNEAHCRRLEVGRGINHR